jgi:hypothetical protein
MYAILGDRRFILLPGCRLAVYSVGRVSVSDNLAVCDFVASIEVTTYGVTPQAIASVVLNAVPPAMFARR